MNTDTKTNDATNELTTAIGGRHISVSFRDNRPPETIFIRELSVRETDQAIVCLENEMALAQLMTAQSAEYLDSISIKSFNEIIERGQELNSDFFDYCLRRAKRRQEMQDRLMPGMRERMLATAEKAMTDRLAVSGLPSVPSAPA